ncbi:hypothetical protein ACNKHO_16840 [Shigella flexneri]
MLLSLSWVAIWFGHTSALALIVGNPVLDLMVQGVHSPTKRLFTGCSPMHVTTDGRRVRPATLLAVRRSLPSLRRQHVGPPGRLPGGEPVAGVNLLVWWWGYHRQDADSGAQRRGIRTRHRYVNRLSIP